jgi:hypothetical protein
MIPLPSPIHKGGFELTMLKRLGRVAIYRQHLPGGSPDQDAYEVILPQTRTTKYTGEAVDPYEGYPAAESWGKKGWTFTSLAKAIKKLKRLQKFAQKGPCSGTVSRKTRHGGQGRLRGGSLANFSQLIPVTRPSAAPVYQSSERQPRRKVRLSSPARPCQARIRRLIELKTGEMLDGLC